MRSQREEARSASDQKPHKENFILHKAQKGFRCHRSRRFSPSFHKSEVAESSDRAACSDQVQNSLSKPNGSRHQMGNPILARPGFCGRCCAVSKSKSRAQRTFSCGSLLSWTNEQTGGGRSTANKKQAGTHPLPAKRKFPFRISARDIHVDTSALTPRERERESVSIILSL